MRLDKLYKQKFVVSFEIFPPRTEKGEEILWNELKELSVYRPDFVSVTYGAGGSTRDKTLEIAMDVYIRFGIEPLVHFTCVNAGRDEIRDYLEEVKEKGIQNVLALRGDPPTGETHFTPHPDGFAHASELIKFIHGINGFTIAAAGYPEGHIEAPDLETDIRHLKEKIDAGASFIISQLFYDNEYFYTFMNRVEQLGIRVPIIPGIMPVTSHQQIKKITGLCGATIPDNLTRILDTCSTEGELCEAGLDFSVEQCHQLKEWGVPGFHIYTVNRSRAVIRIMEDLNLMPG